MDTKQYTEQEIRDLYNQNIQDTKEWDKRAKILKGYEIAHRRGINPLSFYTKTREELRIESEMVKESKIHHNKIVDAKIKQDKENISKEYARIKPLNKIEIIEKDGQHHLYINNEYQSTLHKSTAKGRTLEAVRIFKNMMLFPEGSFNINRGNKVNKQQDNIEPVKQEHKHTKQSLEDKVNRFYELSVNIDNTRELLKSDPAYRLVSLVPTHGDYTGEIKYITAKQYKQFFGREPMDNVKDKQGRIKWEYVLDQLNTSEHGNYETADQLKEAIEKLASNRNSIGSMEIERASIEKELRATLPEQDIKKIMDNAPVFPRKEETKAIELTIGGYTIIARRNPSFYQVSDNNPNTPDFRVRYSDDARRLMNTASKGYLQEQAGMIGLNVKESKPGKPITPLEQVEGDTMTDAEYSFRLKDGRTYGLSKTKQKSKHAPVKNITAIRGVRSH